MTTEKRQGISQLAKRARVSTEALLDALGWPKEDLALHRAVDRLLQIEEESRERR